MQNKINNGVAAVIVTYNGDEELIANMQALLAQCEKVVIVDNNSTVDMSAEFEFAEKNNVEIIKNAENLGIAAALNIGVRHVIDLGFKYYITMDQDSVLYDDCVKKMMDVLSSNKKIGSVFPNLRRVRKRLIKTTTFLTTCRCITSGNLVRTEVFEKVGGYDEDLFIDGVDHVFNFKTVMANYRLVKVNNAFMKQKFGTLKKGKFGKNLRSPSAFRSYYIARNSRYVRKKYFFRFPMPLIILWMYYRLDYLRLRLFSKEWASLKQGFKRGKKDYKLMRKKMTKNSNLHRQ